MKKLIILILGIILGWLMGCAPTNYCRITKVTKLNPLPHNSWYCIYQYQTECGSYAGIKYIGNVHKPGDLLKVKTR